MVIADHDQNLRPLKDAVWLTSRPLTTIFALFESAGREVRAVGGAVRNTLLDLPVTDIDLATPVRPDEVMFMARAAGLGAHPTGIDHGTVTIVAHDHPVEVTTLRRDVETDGRRAVVAFTDDWREDAERRDFTINAIYALPDGSLYDPVGGLADLEAKRVRFIGKAQDRIREDYLRILRFFRFSAAYGEGHLDAEGLRAATDLKGGLASLSGERVGAEMLKLLAAPRAADVIAIMHDAGILSAVLGKQAHPGTLARLTGIESARGSGADAVARLAALALEGTGDGRASVQAISTALRLSNADTEKLESTIRSSSAFDPATPEAEACVALYRLGVETFTRAAIVAWARSNASITDAARLHRLNLPQRWPIPSVPYRGADVIARGVAPGPRVGAILRAFEEWWVSAGFPGDSAMQQHKLQAIIDQG